LYLTVQTGIGNLNGIVANRFPVAWSIFRLKNEDGKDDSTYNIRWPDTHFTFDLEENARAGTKVHLYEQFDHLEYQRWKIERCEDDL